MGTARGQQAAELMLVFATAFAIFLVFYAVFAQQYADSMRSQAMNEGASVADMIAGEIDLAARAGDGYERRITYPTSIPGVLSYELIVNNRSGSVDISMTLGVGTQQYNYSSPTLTRNISGEQRYAVDDGFWLEIERGYAYLENDNGTISIVQMRID
ncbi:Uncharacterised protein [uncultured archaeon]|nr:Uncharacterised protein [uncultured archaeon]